VRHEAALKLLVSLPRETGTIGLGWGITGMRVVFSTREIGGTKDIKGMKLRINPTPVYRDFYQQLAPRPRPSPRRRCSTPWPTARWTGWRPTSSSRGTSASTRRAKSMLQMNALFMPFAPLGLGPRLAGPERPDRELIRGWCASVARRADPRHRDHRAGPDREIQGRSLPDQDRVHPGRGRAGARVRQDLLPKAPQIAELCKVGAAL
jgi:hypothetical protein